MRRRNPYNYTMPVESKMFFGRQDEIASLINQLATGQGNSILLVGGRRMGKTSLLEALRRELLTRVRKPILSLIPLPVFLDLMGKDIDSPAAFFRMLCEQSKIMVEEILSQPSKTTCVCNEGQTSFRTFQNSLEIWRKFALEQQNCRLRLILLLDECEEILEHPWSSDLQGALRALLIGYETRDLLKVVMAGSHRLLAQTKQSGSPLRNVLTSHKLRVFDAQATRELIVRPTRDCLSNETMQAIASQSGGHAFLIQFIMRHLWERGIENATPEVVQQIAVSFPKERSDFRDWANYLGNPGLMVYSTLARANLALLENDILTHSHIAPLDVADALDILCYHGLVVKDINEERYSVAGQMFREWFMTYMMGRPEQPTLEVFSGTTSTVDSVAHSGSPTLDTTPRRFLMTHLNHQQYEQFVNALLDAFRNLDRLEQMLRFKLDKNLQEITTANSLRTVAFKLIDRAEEEDWTLQLVVAARESNPGNSRLLEFSQQFDLAPIGTPPEQGLERIIRATNSFLDVNKWRTCLGEIETRVCRIEIQSDKGMIYGTGFLLGPDVVMTNYHVMQEVIGDKRATPNDVRLRFDYKRLADGTTLNHGKVFRLVTKDWLIDKSSLSSIDNIPEPKPSLPQPDQLDYALLRVAEFPGSRPVGDKSEPDAPVRGWIKIPPSTHDFLPNTALFIVQHPSGAPLQLALDTNAIIGVNANYTRVTYRTNTLPGSSGSPCFNSNWELVALHHSGDPNFASTHAPTYNEGIPFASILALLEQRGLKGVLG